MKTEETMKLIDELKYVVETLESERAIISKCYEKGLNPECASDYAKAAIEVLEYEQPDSFISEREKRQSPPSILLDISSREDECIRCENDLQATQTIISLYSYIGEIVGGMWNSISGKKKKYGGIKNQSGEKIGIVGNKKKGDRISLEYLRSGHHSSEVFEDADGVVILKGQKYRKPGFSGYVGDVVTEGALKILDWSHDAEVIKSGGVLCVKAVPVIYLTTSQAKAEGWPLPY